MLYSPPTLATIITNAHIADAALSVASMREATTYLLWIPLSCLIGSENGRYLTPTVAGSESSVEVIDKQKSPPVSHGRKHHNCVRREVMVRSHSSHCNLLNSLITCNKIGVWRIRCCIYHTSSSATVYKTTTDTSFYVHSG